MSMVKRLLVVDLSLDSNGGKYVIQLDESLHSYGFTVDSCIQPNRLVERLSAQKNYDLMLLPLASGEVTPSVCNAVTQLLARLSKNKDTARIPLLLLLLNGDGLNKGQLQQLDKLMQSQSVDFFTLPSSPGLLAIKCFNQINRSKSFSPIDLPQELSQAVDRVKGLSRREAEILNLMADGMSNREISQSLTLSEHSIRTHIYHIFAKLGIKRRSQAVLVDMCRKFNLNVN